MGWGSMGPLEGLFGFEGRMSRQPFWLCLPLLFVVTYILYAVLIGMTFGRGGVPPLAQATPEQMRLLTWISLTVNLIILLPSLALTIKRLHDRDRSAWWCLPYIGPDYLPNLSDFLGLSGTGSVPSLLAQGLSLLGTAVLAAYIVDLGIGRGTVGRNRYGPDPLGQGSA
jgi:uncharacterized membrane protein YhaH (DUF805 family)